MLKQQLNLKILCLLLCGGFTNAVSGQIIGGSHIFEFLSLPGSARISGLGGAIVAVQDDDLISGLHNPALFNERNHNSFALNHSFHLAGSQHGYAGYAYHHEPLATTFQAGIQYMNYGDFKSTDDIGNIDGEFSAKEFAINLSAARQIYDKLTAGASLKVITSQLEGYNSFGLAMDFGAHYRDTSGRFTAGLVFKNIGIQLNPFVDGNRENLAMDIQFGISQRLKHLPFRIGIVAHDLQRWNILYDDPNTVDNDILSDFNNSPEANPFGDFVDNFFRHMIFSGEFLFGKTENLTLQFAYNHQRRQELTVSYASRSLTGFSLGFGLKIKRFRINFGHQFYHLAGGNNHFSLSTKLGKW